MPRFSVHKTPSLPAMGRTLLSLTGFLILLLALFMPLTSQADERVVLVVGDSLSAAYGMDRDEGWVTLLDRRLADEAPGWRAANASVSGDTTRAGLSRLPDALDRHRPEVVIIVLGGNDGLRGIAPDEIERNLERMISAVHDAGAEALLAGVRIPPNYGAAYVERFQQTFTNAAGARDATLVSNILDGVDEQRDLMQDDGIHPAPEAQSQMLDNIWPELRPILDNKGSP